MQQIVGIKIFIFINVLITMDVLPAPDVWITYITIKRIRETKVKYTQKNYTFYLRTCIFNFKFTVTSVFHMWRDVEDTSESIWETR